MVMGWSASGRQCNVMKSNLPLLLRRKVYSSAPYRFYNMHLKPSLTKVLKRKLQSPKGNGEYNV